MHASFNSRSNFTGNTLSWQFGHRAGEWRDSREAKRGDNSLCGVLCLDRVQHHTSAVHANSQATYIGSSLRQFCTGAKAAALAWATGLLLLTPAYTRAANMAAEAELAREVQLHPDNFGANNRLGEFYAAAGKYASAVHYLERAYAIQPDSYGNAYDLGLAYLKGGDTAKARAIAENLLRAQDKPELHNLLGAISDAESRYREAIAEYEKAARADPSEQNVFDLANELVSHGAFEPALQIFQYGSAKYPHSARLRVGQGVAQYSLGQYTAAIQSLCQAVDIDPSDPRALDFLGKMYDISPAMAEEVAKRLAHFVELYPQNARANYYYALSLRKRPLETGSRKEWPQAEALLKKSTTLDPLFVDAHYQLGRLYEDEGRTAEAIHEYGASVQLRKDLSAAHYRLALLYKKTGKPALARQEFAVVEELKQEKKRHGQ
jgi:tetratricopeptide (TPR) repeat protein